MKALCIALLMINLVAAEVLAECTGTCPEGYISACVEINGNCRCTCVEKARAGSQVRGLLEAAGLSPQGIETGVRLFTDELNSGKRGFVIEFTDRDSTVIIRASFGDENDGPKGNDGVTAAASAVHWPLEPKDFRGVPFGASLKQTEKILRLYCSSDKRTKIGVCLDRYFAIGPVTTQNVFEFDADRLVRIRLSFPSSSFATLRDIFIERYGQPSATQTQSVL
jgi:hypothetical protein